MSSVPACGAHRAQGGRDHVLAEDTGTPAGGPHYRATPGVLQHPRYRRAYRIAGQGPAVLLIHGIGDNSTTWLDVIAHLASRHTVIAPDLLGHGRSDKPRADYSVPAYANGMRDLLAVLGIDEVTVVGHSLGGGVAMQFAYQFPHLVQRMCWCPPGASPGRSTPPCGSRRYRWLRNYWDCCSCRACCPPSALWATSWSGWATTSAMKPPTSCGCWPRYPRPVRLPAHVARGGGLARSGGHHARPQLPHPGHAGAVDLG